MKTWSSSLFRRACVQTCSRHGPDCSICPLLQVWTTRSFNLIAKHYPTGVNTGGLSLILYMITKNIRYLLWNPGAWRSFLNAQLTFLAPSIRLTDHLCESCGLMDIKPHFVQSPLPVISKWTAIDLLWRHSYISRLLTIPQTRVSGSCCLPLGALQSM